MKIDKDTLLFMSASSAPGNFGSIIHNMAFNYYGINAIYKSFKINNISNLITSKDMPGDYLRIGKKFYREKKDKIDGHSYIYNGFLLHHLNA